MMLDRRLFRLVLLAPGPAALGIALALASTAAAVGQAFAIAAALAAVLDGGDWGAASTPTAVALAAGILRAALLSCRDLAYAWTAARVKARVREQLLDQLVLLGPMWVGRRRQGEVQATVADGVEALQAYVGYYLPQAAVSVLAPAALVVVLFVVDPVVGATVGLAAAVVPAVRPLWQKVLGRKGRQFWEAYAAFAGRVLEALQGMTTLKLYRASDRYGTQVVAQAQALARAQTGNLRTSLSVYILVTVAFGVGTAAAVVVATLRYSSGDLTSAGVLLVLVLAAECFRPLLDLQNYWHEGFYGVGAASGLTALMTATPGVRDGPATLDIEDAPEVRFENVSFRYPVTEAGRGPGQDSAGPDQRGADRTDQVALRDVSFTVPAGATVGLVGRSGAGKTTITNLVMRLADPDSGRVLIGGVNLRDLTLASARSLVSVVSQDVYLFHGSVADNVRLGRPDATDDQVEAVARAANAHEFVLALPHGYATVVGDRGARLSGGERQRLAIARALLVDAPVLLLDEATSSVDGENERLIQQALARLRNGRTTIVVAHRLSTVAGADAVVVLDTGRVVEQGPVRELLAADGPFSRLVAAQHVRAGAR